jgi:hypothetical protein
VRRRESKKWTDDAEGDPGITFLELFAYLAESLSHYQDEVAAEARLKTRRRNAFALLAVVSLAVWRCSVSRRCRDGITRHCSERATSES